MSLERRLRGEYPHLDKQKRPGTQSRGSSGLWVSRRLSKEAIGTPAGQNSSWNTWCFVPPPSWEPLVLSACVTTSRRKQQPATAPRLPLICHTSYDLQDSCGAPGLHMSPTSLPPFPAYGKQTRVTDQKRKQSRGHGTEAQ